jgi:phosphatidate cytidylyltransferase
VLKQRILTALVLLAVLLPALIASQPWPFAILMMVAMAIAGWEWARLNGAGALSIPLGLALAAACALALYAGWATTAPRLAWWLAL